MAERAYYYAKVEELENEVERVREEMENFYIEDYLTEEEFCEYMDMEESSVTVYGITFEPSRILRELDPIAFDHAYSEWVDSHEFTDIDEYCELQDELDSLEDELAEARDELDDFDDE